MANPFIDAAINPMQFFAPDVAADATQLARRQAMVDALRARATAEDPTQVVSGIAIKQSPLGRIASSLVADYQQRQIDEQQAEMARRYAQALGGGGGAGGAGLGGVIDGDTLRQAAMLDAVSPGAGKALIQSRIEQNKPVDVVRTAQQLFPNDPAGQQQYLQAYARKQTEMTRTPGSYVVGMDGQMIETPMSAEGKRRLELQERSTAAQESRAQTAAREAQQAAGTGGGFAGTSLEAQASNMYRDLMLKQQAGQPLTPAEQMNLELAKRALERPQLIGNLETGVTAVPRPLPGLPSIAPAGAPAASEAPMAAPAQATPPAQPGGAIQVLPPQAGNIERKITEEARAKAKLELPAIEDDVNAAISQVEKLVNDPNLGSLVGNPAGMLTKRIPNQPAADIASRLGQIRGGAFLAAIQKMKGSGAISEAEGQAATQAITSMSEAQSLPAFKAAADEYMQTLERGRQRARELAGVKAPANTEWGIRQK